MADVRSGYARTDDGLQLYWRTVGEGPPMVCCNGVGVSTFFWKYIARHFRGRFQILLWDYRGHGRSGTPADPRSADLSMARNARDMAQVMAAAGIDEPAILLGHSMGVQVILEFAVQHPERVRALIPLFGTFARPMDTFMDSPYSRRIFDLVNKVAAFTGKAGGRMLHPLYANPLAFAIGKATGMVDPYYANPRDIDAYMEHLVHMDPQVFLRMVEMMADHDLTDALPSITCPVLIFAGEKDLFTPLHRSRKMAELLPCSELFILAEGSHAAIVEHPDTINHRIERFLADHHLTAEPAVSAAASS